MTFMATGKRAALLSWMVVALILTWGRNLGPVGVVLVALILQNQFPANDEDPVARMYVHRFIEMRQVEYQRECLLIACPVRKLLLSSGNAVMDTLSRGSSAPTP
jgi:hypothetical protein